MNNKYFFILFYLFLFIFIIECQHHFNLLMGSKVHLLIIRGVGTVDILMGEEEEEEVMGIHMEVVKEVMGIRTVEEEEEDMVTRTVVVVVVVDMVIRMVVEDLAMVCPKNLRRGVFA